MLRSVTYDTRCRSDNRGHSNRPWVEGASDQVGALRDVGGELGLGCSDDGSHTIIYSTCCHCRCDLEQGAEDSECIGRLHDCSSGREYVV